MKIHRVTLPSTNVEGQEELYSRSFGLPGHWETPDRLVISCGASELVFARASRQFYFHYCFLVPPGCMEAVCSALDGCGLDSLLHDGKRLVEFTDGLAVYFRDADGNIAEFIQRPTLGHGLQNHFDFQDILCVNEIGVPAKDPVATATKYVARYSIEPLCKAAYHDEFVWCGDYEGVLLIPRVGRPWLPLTKQAEENELLVQFSTKTGNHELDVRLSGS